MSEWNKYPETKPSNTGRYLVTSKNSNGAKNVDIKYYSPISNRFFGEEDYGYNTTRYKVIAWRELEKPFEG